MPVPRGSSVLIRGPAYDSTVPVLVDAVADWPLYNRSLDGSRASPLTDITTDNVGRLVRVCDIGLDEKADLQSGPVEVGGTLYLTTAQHTYAIDATTCRLRWKYSYAYDPGPDFDLKVNRGVAFAAGRLYRGSNDGRVYAIDARTGREVWSVVAANPRQGETFPAAPVVWKGLVLIGNAGGDNFGVVGKIMAFDTADGGRRWSVPLVPESGPAAATWPSHTEVIPKAGGATWTSYAVDTLTGDLVLGTGNAAPDFLLAARSGANLHTTSVVVLDSRDGTLRWARQLVTADIHDWDLSAAPSLVTTRGGKRLVVEAGKDGYLHALDRTTGQVVYRAEVATHENVETPLGPKPTRFCPGVNGGVEWNGPAFAKAANLLVVGSIDWCTTVTIAPVSALEGKSGLPWTGSSELRHPFGVPDTTRSGWLTAVDAESGAIRWRYKSSVPLVAGVTATAGGLILTGDLKGDVLAFEAATGKLLWHDSTGLPIGGGVVTYRAGGRQFVAVAAGMHAPTTWQIESAPAHLLVYALPP
ncbi:MAG: PQQ-binding-like beta-propeller repeat protein [Gemmatimonadota bacterium]